MKKLRDGYLYIKNKDLIISPKLSKKEFKSSDLYNDVISHDIVNEYPSYLIKPQIIADNLFTIRVLFNKEGNVFIINLDMTDGVISNWNNWSKRNNNKKKKDHDIWLKSQLGNPPYKYDWGEILSKYEAKSGASVIIIRYF